MDVRDPALGSVIRQERVDTIIHLAFVLFPIRDLNTFYDIDVNGSRNVLAACENSSIRKIILSSSTSVYGVHPDNPLPMTEDQPFRPNPDNHYGVHKTEVEGLLREFAETHHDVTVTVFRPCMFLGPNVDNLICQLAVKLPTLIKIKNHNPLLQFVHEEDVVGAIALALQRDMPGAFNLVGKGTVTMEEFCAAFGKGRIELNYRLLYTGHNLLWKLRFPLITFNPGWLNYLHYSSIASGEKLEAAHGFAPSFTTERALRSYVEERTKQ